MKYILIILLGLICLPGTAQNKKYDSLRNPLKNENSKLHRFDQINRILESQLKNGGNIDTALCLEMIGLAENLNNDSLLAIGLNMAGSFTARKGDYPSSLEYLFKGIPMAEKARDKRRISSLYFDISLVYVMLKNLKEAYYYNMKGKENLPEKSSSDYDFMAAQFNRNMVRYYLLANRPDSALPFLKQLEEVGRRLRIPVIYMPSLFLSGAAFSELGNKDSADNYFRAAVNYSDSVEFFGLRWTNDRYYIPYLIQEGRIDEARARALQLFKIGEDHHNADIRLTASEFLSTIYNGLHQPDSAYYFSKAELSMKDSVFSENNMNKEEALAFNEKLRGMEEKRQAEQREKQKEQNLMYIAIGFGVFVLVVLFLFQLKARRKEMKDRLADQRERISKELHDNVGSQLSFISGNIDWLIDSFGYLSKEQEINKLNLVSETSKTIVNELRETIWAIKKETIKLDELSDKVKSFLLEQTSIYPDIETEIVENIQKEYQLQPNESLNVYRICQEAIHNCLKHAQASRLRLHILSDPRKYYLISISDNGKGFDTTSRKQGHFGLDNMMQRARESGVSLTLKSEPGKGTEVTVMKLN